MGQTMSADYMLCQGTCACLHLCHFVWRLCRSPSEGCALGNTSQTLLGTSAAQFTQPVYTAAYLRAAPHLPVLPTRPLPLVGGAWAPGPALLLVDRQVLLLTHGAAAPGLAAIAGRHCAAHGNVIIHTGHRRNPLRTQNENTGG